MKRVIIPRHLPLPPAKRGVEYVYERAPAKQGKRKDKPCRYEMLGNLYWGYMPPKGEYTPKVPRFHPAHETTHETFAHDPKAVSDLRITAPMVKATKRASPRPPATERRTTLPKRPSHDKTYVIGNDNRHLVKKGKKGNSILT